MTTTAAHLEWVPFRAADGVSDADLIAAADRLHHEFLAAEAGYVRRSLLRDAEGAFVDCVAWRSAADHAAAMERAMAHPAAQAFFACLADPQAAGAAMQHFAIVRDWT
ncbi:MAG: hypothetical protein MUE41_12455 [Gemmatimonadaceae bacterium]|jgi:hypothetical protein|nr:hypothetical protein [Gemmatimonadaceae bacterium]